MKEKTTKMNCTGKKSYIYIIKNIIMGQMKNNKVEARRRKLYFKE